MIGVPFEDNDLTCLGKITEIIAELVMRRPPWLVELAARLGSTEDLAAWIRSLPQRDDEGLEGDGPKVAACEPWQRLRIPADDPNCVRTALYVAVCSTGRADRPRRRRRRRPQPLRRPHHSPLHWEPSARSLASRSSSSSSAGCAPS
jgi:hypothetical protein